jgi:hypothetical protein
MTVHPPTVPPTITPRLGLDEAGERIRVGVLDALATTVTVRYNSGVIELANMPQLRIAVLVKPLVAQPCCVMVVRLYTINHLEHSGLAASVHLRTRGLVEHIVSVQMLGMAVLAMHVVGMIQEESEAGSQQPWTPWRVFVAQMKFELGHVIEDSVHVRPLGLCIVGIVTYVISRQRNRMYCRLRKFGVERARSLGVVLLELVLDSNCRVIYVLWVLAVTMGRPRRMQQLVQEAHTMRM